MTFSLPPNNLPVVAIVGRPNVGKSTLFNRLIGKRKAITDPTPGVTRDPVPEPWSVDGKPLLLVDTGGYQPDTEGLNMEVTERSLAVLEKASLILFLMDVQDVTPLDLSFLESIRRYSEKIILVVNKVDTETRDPSVWDFYSYGFSRVIAVSAAHGRGCDALYDAISDMLPDPGQSGPEPLAGPHIRISILGKPNTGKSTLLNALTGTNSSITSDIPGTTRDVVSGSFSYKNKDFLVLDTAGIRRKNRVEESIEYYSVTRAIKTIEDSEIVLLLIDASEGLSDQDKKIADLAVRKGRGVLLLLNKWDILPPQANRLEAYKDRISFLFPILDFAPVLPLSALTGEGIKKMLNMILTVHSQLFRRVETGKLNKGLAQWQERTPPPRNKSFQFKVKYITQITVNPLRFVAFVNRSKGFPRAYLQYLINNLRKEFGFDKVPVSLDLKEK